METFQSPGERMVATFRRFLMLVMAVSGSAAAAPAIDAIARCADGDTPAAARIDACDQVLAGAHDVQVRSNAYLHRAEVHFLNGRGDAAFADGAQAIALDPDNLLAYAQRGQHHNAHFEYERAIADFSVVIARQPDAFNSRLGRALAYAELGRHELAVADYDVAVGLAPDDAGLVWNRGLSHAALKRWDDARADFERTIALSPDYAGEFERACFGPDPERRVLANWPRCEGGR